jgi:hypothetical protein
MCFSEAGAGALSQRNTLDCVWNVMARAHKPDFVFRRNRRVHLNRRGRQFNRLLAAEVCASAVVMLDAPCSEVVWRVLATHSICQFPLHFPSLASHFNWTLRPVGRVIEVSSGIFFRGPSSKACSSSQKVCFLCHPLLLLSCWTEYEINYRRY